MIHSITQISDSAEPGESPVMSLLKKMGQMQVENGIKIWVRLQQNQRVGWRQRWIAAQEKVGWSVRECDQPTHIDTFHLVAPLGLCLTSHAFWTLKSKNFVTLPLFFPPFPSSSLCSSKTQLVCLFFLSFLFALPILLTKPKIQFCKSVALLGWRGCWGRGRRESLFS